MTSEVETNPEPVLLRERRGPILILTMNRPKSMNAMNAELASALGQAIDEGDKDSSVWVIILTGAGDRSFCAGADLKAAARGESNSAAEPAFEKWRFGGFVKHVISKPIIAAVNGFALGGGTELALASDLIVAADTATFGLPEVKRAIIASAGGAFRLPQHLPKKIAMEMVLTGEAISAERARELGLVNKVVPRAQLLDAAVELAERICVNAPLAVQAAKRVALAIDGDQIAADEQHWERSTREAAQIRTSADRLEGIQAFAEKRTPVWKGR